MKIIKAKTNLLIKYYKMWILFLIFTILFYILGITKWYHFYLTETEAYLKFSQHLNRPLCEH